MKIALISDIQGNAVALEAVLADVHFEQPDVIVCLGDVASGAEPAAVLDMLRSHQCLTVKGNMDDVILNPELYTGEDETLRKYADMDQWCSEQLTENDRAYMQSFQSLLTVELSDEVELLCFHGSPKSYNDVIEAITPDDELSRLLDGYSARVMATGHLHTPMLRRWQQTLLLNPGSVGLPDGGKRGNMPTRAEYAVIRHKTGQLQVKFNAIEYDAREFQRRVFASRMPHADWYLTQWIS
jgi:putative phosphoesterase